MKPKTEKQFMDNIMDLAHKTGWVIHHDYHSKIQGKNDKGFPDLIMGKGSVIIAAELKRDRREIVTSEQLFWLSIFRNCGTIARVWYPDDIEEIENLLTRR